MVVTSPAADSLLMGRRGHRSRPVRKCLYISVFPAPTMSGRDAGLIVERRHTQMTKRIALLVVVLTVFTAPALMAEHCFKCKVVPGPAVRSFTLHTNTKFH